MAYKNIEPKLTNIDELSSSCGLFTLDTDECYGCISKSKEKDGNSCMSWNCPLCVCADMLALKEHDKYLYEEYLPAYNEHGKPLGIAEEDFEVADWVVQYREVPKRRK